MNDHIEQRAAGSLTGLARRFPLTVFLATAIGLSYPLRSLDHTGRTCRRTSTPGRVRYPAEEHRTRELHRRTVETPTADQQQSNSTQSEPSDRSKTRPEEDQ